MKQNPTVSRRAEVVAPNGVPQQYWIPSSAAASESTLQHLVHSPTVDAEWQSSGGSSSSSSTGVGVSAKKVVEAVKKFIKG